MGEWGLSGRDERELERHLPQAIMRLQLQERPPTEYDLRVWSGWISLFLEDRERYRAVARDRVLSVLRASAVRGETRRAP
jgi:hypothetical protein